MGIVNIVLIVEGQKVSEWAPMFKIENSMPDELEESKGRKVECHCFSACCRPAAKSIGLANGKDSDDSFYTRGNCDKCERR